MKLVSSLAGGTEAGYAVLAFSDEAAPAATPPGPSTSAEGAADGAAAAAAAPAGPAAPPALLASVGGAPDYLLALWDWRSGAEVLRCKAFSQEVYGVRFSPASAGSLVTYGLGHIRFWRMASTFTGLKLQGALGKWGALELADVCGAVELLGGGGGVVAGSDAGDLLVWEGGLVRALVERPGGLPAHKGPIQLLHYDAGEYGGGGGVGDNNAGCAQAVSLCCSAF